MKKANHILLKLVLGLQSLFTPLAYSAMNSEMHVQVDSSLIQSALNQAVSSVSNSNQEIIRKLPNYSHEVSFNLKNISIDPEMTDFAKELGKVDLQGNGKLNVLLESPQVKGALFLGEPTFIKRSDGMFDVSVQLQIRNFNIQFKHIWFTSSGIIELDPLHHQSCHSLIGSDQAIEGQDFLLDSNLDRAHLKNFLSNFYSNLDHASFKGHQGKLWARIDQASLGWSGKKKYYSDNRNLFIANLKLRVDPKKNGKRIELVSFTHNLNKKNGSWIPVSIPESGIVIPPTFIRTQSRKIVDDTMTHEEITRCTYVNHNPIQKLISSFSKVVSKEITLQLTDENISKLVQNANQMLSNISIPEIPNHLIYTNENSSETSNSNKRIVHQDLNFDFNQDLFGILKSFTTYRAALGLDGLNSSPSGDSLEIGINSDLKINGKTLNYQEDYFGFTPIKAKDFKWTQDFISNASVAINGNFLNKIINPIKDHLLKTKVPSAFSVQLNDNLFDVDYQGQIEITPKIELAYKGLDLLRVMFTVKAKPEIKLGQDGTCHLKLKLSVPNAKTIISNIRPSTAVTLVEVASNLLFGPLLTTGIKQEVLELMRSEMQQYIDNINANIKDIDLTAFTKEYGIRPTGIYFHKLSKDTYMETKFNVDKIPGLDDAVKDLI